MPARAPLAAALTLLLAGCDRAWERRCDDPTTCERACAAGRRDACEWVVTGDPRTMPGDRPTVRRLTAALSIAGCRQPRTPRELARCLAVADRLVGEEAARRNRVACAGGSGRGCRELGLRFLGCRGVPCDPARGAEFLRHARYNFERVCDGDDGRGCVDLAMLYEAGEGVPASHERALTYLRRACLMRSPGCCHTIASESLSPVEFAAYLDDLRRRPVAPAAPATAAAAL